MAALATTTAGTPAAEAMAAAIAFTAATVAATPGSSNSRSFSARIHGGRKEHVRQYAHDSVILCTHSEFYIMHPFTKFFPFCIAVLGSCSLRCPRPATLDLGSLKLLVRHLCAQPWR